MARSKSGIGNRIAPARFVAFLLIALVAMPVGTGALGWQRGVMAGFDISAVIFLLSCASFLRDSNVDSIRTAAARNDANRALLLGLTLAVTLVILVAVGAELGSGQKPSMIDSAVVIATLILAWLFSNTVYALHYAHLFYSSDKMGKDSGGIDFPGEDDPDYGDFLYFAFTLGMTFQTSDTRITNRRVRRVATLHCLAAFIFDLGVIAFTINVLGS